MASLHKLLSEEGFERHRPRKHHKKVKFKDSNAQEDSIALPIYICHDRRSFRGERALSVKGSSVLSSRRGGSGSERSIYGRSVSVGAPRRNEPAIDDVAIKAMVSILNGYVGQYLRDSNFRDSLREKSFSCFVRRKKHSDNEILTHLKLGIQCTERLVENHGVKREMDLESLKYCIKLLLDVVSSLNSTKNGATCGTPNSYLSACAQLYLSIVYKTARNDRISARHLLQVFCDSPFHARTHLLPELWEHFFLPHLLHLKIWYSKELEFLSCSDFMEKEKKIRALNELYNEQMDTGTTKFALYYKDWLKVGAQAPSVPSMPLPSKPRYARSRRRSADFDVPHISVSNKSLYQEVFGSIPKGRSMDLSNRYEAVKWDLLEEEYICRLDDKDPTACRRQLSQSNGVEKAELRSDSQRTDYFRFLACRNEPVESFVKGINMPRNDKLRDEESCDSTEFRDITDAISTICSSGSLIDCEMSIRTVSRGWLNSHGDPRIENLLSQVSVIQGIMEVLFVSDEDEVLELAISILAVLATKREMNRRYILNSDPQLEVSIRLLRSRSLFLKAAALLYLVKPEAKQMIYTEWIPLVLRVLEFSDHTQTLFTVKCSPQEAAYYFLDQLLTGFHEDKNLENARHIVSLGGLSLLVRRMEEGDTFEKSKAASVLYYCIQADGSCRHYIAKNLKKDGILSLLVLGKQVNSGVLAISLLMESLCLSRRKDRMESLSGLTNGWSSLNTMHILLLHLQKARIEERPIIAVIMLQLDLMGDSSECSVYREEAIDAMINTLDSLVLDEKVQQQTARALLILGGHFSYSGEPEVEKWLLRQAGFDENNESPFYRKDANAGVFLKPSEEDKTRESWQHKLAAVLLRGGNKRFVPSLLNAIVNGIPCLARASLVTVCWMSCSLCSLGDTEFQFAASSVLVPQLVQSLHSDRALEERILASYTLLTLSRDADHRLRSPQLDDVLLVRLGKLCKVTWTAVELISLVKTRRLDAFPSR